MPVARMCGGSTMLKGSKIDHKSLQLGTAAMWQKASWSSKDDARQLEYSKLDHQERIQFFLIHGSNKSETEGLNNG